MSVPGKRAASLVLARPCPPREGWGSISSTGARVMMVMMIMISGGDEDDGDDGGGEVMMGKPTKHRNAKRQDIISALF